MARATPEAVMQAYAEQINAHDFDLLSPLIARDAIFWFSSGSHRGLTAIRAAFEQTWHRLKNETYWLTDIVWLARDGNTASCLYRFHWRAERDGAPAVGSGRGTSVLVRYADGWSIAHEHLSAEPE